MKTQSYDFSRHYLSLLQVQKERMLRTGKDPDKKGGFKSVGEVLGSDRYINYKKNEYGKQNGVQN
jgi:hypothetical protein